MKLSSSHLLPVIAAFVLSTAEAQTIQPCPGTFPAAGISQLWDVDFTPALHFYQKLEGYKSPASVDRYLACWQKSPELNRLYLTKYKAMIQRAADSTGVPFAVLACLFFVESRFDKNALSRSGALGLSQFMPRTWRDQMEKLDPKNGVVRNIYMDENIRRLTPKGSPLDAKATEFGIFFKKALKDGKISGRADLAQLERLLRPFLKSKDPILRQNVAEYLSNVHAALDTRAYREAYERYYERGGKNPPKLNLKETAKPEHRSDEELAIILSALYLKMDVYRGIYGRNTRYPSRDQFIISTGGYNVGPAAIKCSTGMSADECIKITQPTETANQMKSVRNCSEQGNKNPMPGDANGGVKECQQNI